MLLQFSPMDSGRASRYSDSMFDVGMSEMMLLAAIALIAIGPKQLPEVARTVGRILNELKRASADLTHAVMEARDSTEQSLKVTDTPEALNSEGQEISDHHEPPKES